MPIYNPASFNSRIVSGSGLKKTLVKNDDDEDLPPPVLKPEEGQSNPPPARIHGMDKLAEHLRKLQIKPKKAKNIRF